MTDLAVEERGSGPAVVLLHAGIADRRMWDRELAAWSERYRVIRYDVRGYGDSPGPAGDYWDHEDLVGVLDDREVERAAVVGCSNGGRIALDLAVTHPQRLSALVLVGAGTPGLTPPPALAELWQQQETALEEGHYGQVVDLDLLLWVAGVGRTLAEVDTQLVTRVAGWCQANLKREVEGAGGGAPQRLHPLPKDRLGDVTAPVLALVGEHDQLPMHRVAAMVAEGVRDGRCVTVDGVAHLPNLERPDVFDRLVLGFLDDVVGSGS